MCVEKRTDFVRDFSVRVYFQINRTINQPKDLWFAKLIYSYMNPILYTSHSLFVTQFKTVYSLFYSFLLCDIHVKTVSALDKVKVNVHLVYVALSWELMSTSD